MRYLIVLFLGISQVLFAVSWETSLESVLTDTKYKQVQVGIHLMNLMTGEELVSYHADKPFIPASVIKLFTAAMALEQLGPEYVYKTPLYIAGDIKNHVLNGNLYIQGVGDPSLMPHHLSEAIERLQMHYRFYVVDGDLVFDQSRFSDPVSVVRSASPYYTPAGALNLNQNRIDLEVIKSTSKTRLSTLRLKFPQTEYARIYPDVRFLESRSLAKPQVTYKQYVWGDLYHLSGRIAIESSEDVLSLGVSRPGLFTATVFKEIAEEKGLDIQGGIIESTVPDSAVKVCDIEGLSLSQCLTLLLHDSDNMMTEALGKSVVYAQTPKSQITEEDSIATLETYLAQKHIHEISLSDLSGLSSKNRVSPKTMTQFFQTLYSQDRDQFYQLLQVMPVYGKDVLYPETVPTDRFVVYLKSGTLTYTGVNTLAAVLYDKQSRVYYGLSILTNRLHSGVATHRGTLTTPIFEQLLKQLETQSSGIVSS